MGASFAVDVAGLLEALTEQFPDPLLCVRELIQNAADAGAGKIEVDVSYDGRRGLARLSVSDDGRGMNAREVEGYLTIGRSEKDTARHRGRFGVGKLSPYALGFDRMTVETSDGFDTHRLEFRPDGSGSIEHRASGRRGTTVRVYKACSRAEAENLSERTFLLASESCGSIGIPLFVNGVAVNHEAGLPSAYAFSFEGDAGVGVIGLCAEPVRRLMGGGIVLETDAPILGDDVSYLLDSPRLSPTLSRNAVRRDGAFAALLDLAKSQLPKLFAATGRVLEERVERLRQDGAVVERALDADDRAALEWLRARLIQTEPEPPREVKNAPVLETADGDLVSASALMEVLRREQRVPISRVPRTRDEIAGYVDRGVPVLLLYRDLEDFLDRQGIETVEVDGLDEGLEIASSEWRRGEAALVGRIRAPRTGRGLRGRFLGALFAVTLGVGGFLIVSGFEHDARISRAAKGLPTGRTPSGQVAPPPPEAPVAPRRSPPAGLAEGLALLAFLFAFLGGALVLEGRRHRERAWLRDEAGIPLARGEGRRRLAVLLRMVLHPVDFAVARGWSIRSSGASRRAIAGYRAFAQEVPIRVGSRLDLDRLELGFVDLLSTQGDPSDARILLRRGARVLLNRNHPTIRQLAQIAEFDPKRAHLLLEALLATDPELAKNCDPRQVEWDLVGRAPRVLDGRSG